MIRLTCLGKAYLRCNLKFEPGFLPAFLLRPFRAASLAEGLVYLVCQAILNFVPSIQIRCMMTSNFLARAILARFAPVEQ